MIEFGKILKLLREQENLSQAKLAKILNVSQRTIFAWENDKQEPNMQTIVNLAEFFDVSADYLLGLENYDGTKIMKKNNFNNFGQIHNSNITLK